jgi:hypothetical protein
MRQWNPEIRIVRNNDTQATTPWHVELTPGSIIATTSSGRSTDVDHFCAELLRATTTAHQLNLDGDAT